MKNKQIKKSNKKKWFSKNTNNQNTVGTNEPVKKSHVPFRLNFLFFIVFALFVALIVQLSYLQIANGSYFEAKIEWSKKNLVEGSAPRGMIYDSKGEVLVSNQANQAIIFTRKVGDTSKDLFDLANRLNTMINVEAEELTERDKKDFWLAEQNNFAEANKRVSEKEKYNKKGIKLKDSELYPVIVDKVTPEEINFDESTMKAATIFKRMNSTYALKSAFIKNKEVTPEEIAIIGENTKDLSGVTTGMDWEREYPHEESLRTILGLVSSEKTGLPADQIDSYLTQGYSRNDRVGLSYLEKEYEPVLKGTKSQAEITVNNKQEVASMKEVYQGEKGKNLVLTLDLDFEKKVEEILYRNYQQLVNSGRARFSEGAYVVVNNPRTGEILAMTGINHDLETNELTDDTLGTITKAFVPGSSIKGATIMAGFENGVLEGNTTFLDEPIRIGSSNVKQSIFNHSSVIPVDTVKALEISSNVYMMKIVFEMMGIKYVPGMSLPERPDIFEKLRTTYAEFGLGTTTGIDLPGEAMGISRTNFYDNKGNLEPGIMGNLLDLSFGNFDTYTPMQLAQYISTIANDGQRVAPHVVKGVYSNDESGNLGDVEYMMKPKVLGQVGTKDSLDIIQKGMYQVVNGSDPRRTGRNLQGAKYIISAKTGTAETFANTNSGSYAVINSTLVGYAPYDDPKVAVTVVLPMLTDDNSGMNTLIAREIFDAYYDFAEKNQLSDEE